MGDTGPARTSAVVTTAWLEAHGVNSDQARKLASSDWLQRVGTAPTAVRGISSPGRALSLPCRRTMTKGCHRSGRTLALHGFAHYLPMGQASIHLFGRKGARLPRWLSDVEWAGRVVLHSDKGLPWQLPGSFMAYVPAGRAFSLQVSTPERAILEWVAVTPNELLFSSELVDTFNGLSTLRPRRLQALLEGCRSVRTKRAFLVLARHAGHTWYSRLDPRRMELGSGKRQLYQGGKLDREYQVTVPEAFLYAD